tara:strand:+ start:2368 stop:3156 length:789 start_codon:yes stop_codon:yes gene_type:complete
METKQKKASAPKQEVKKDNWEYKDRNYFLKGNKEPLTYKLGSRHTPRHSLLWFDKEKGYQRELRYATNQKSVFVDEQEGPVTLAHIIFKDGALSVPKEKQNLQKLLSLYHPAKGHLYEEFDPVVQASDELEDIDMQLDAMNIAKTLDLDQAEAILRVEQGSSVSDMSSKEIKRDILLMAKKNPGMFISLVNDENVILRNFAIKATELQIIKLSQDQRTFHWGTNNRKLMTIPFDENPYSAIASWFKTDEGVEVYKTIEKKLK